jgi:hypothetical protein
LDTAHDRWWVKGLHHCSLLPNTQHPEQFLNHAKKANRQEEDEQNEQGIGQQKSAPNTHANQPTKMTETMTLDASIHPSMTK